VQLREARRRREVGELLGARGPERRIVVVGVEDGADAGQVGGRRLPCPDHGGAQVHRLLGQQAIHPAGEPGVPAHLERQQQVGGAVEGGPRLVQLVPGQLPVPAAVDHRDHRAQGRITTVVGIPGHGLRSSRHTDSTYHQYVDGPGRQAN
jgi:hypothetical protein